MRRLLRLSLFALLFFPWPVIAQQQQAPLTPDEISKRNRVDKDVLSYGRGREKTARNDDGTFTINMTWRQFENRRHATIFRVPNLHTDFC